MAINVVMHAWAAGFLDGEAYFGARVRSQKIDPSKIFVGAEITVAQVCREPLDRLLSLYGGTIRDQMETRPNQRNTFVWSLAGGQKIRDAIPLWLPYLTVKREQAELILELVNLTGRRGEPVSDSNYTRREAIVVELKKVRRAA